VQGWFERKESLGKVRRARRGSRGSLTSFYKSPQRSCAWQLSLRAPIGCLQGILQETRDFYRKTANFYRKSANFYRKSANSYRKLCSQSFGRWTSVWMDRRMRRELVMG